MSIDKTQVSDSAYDWKVSGRHMVSAGAGTGKTYNIQILFLRKILLGIEVSQILVVTYTEMATAELRERLRRVLMDCRRGVQVGLYLEGHGFSPEDIVSVLHGDYADVQLGEHAKEVASYEHSGCKRSQIAPFFVVEGEDGDGFIHVAEDQALSEALGRLEGALREFDQAQVSTIHGFCARMLEVNAFESGLRYGMKVQKSMAAMYKRFLYEFWREFCYGGARPYLRMNCLRWVGYDTPDALQKECETLLSAMGSDIVWQEGVRKFLTMDHAQAAMKRHVAELETSMQALSLDLQDHVEACLAEGGYQEFLKSNVNAHWKQALTPEYLKTNEMLSDEDVALRLSMLKFDKEKAADADTVRLNFFSRVKTEEKLQAKLDGLREGHPWVESYLEWWEQLAEVYHGYRACVLWLCYDWIGNQVTAEKEREGLITFDDMLLSMQHALRDKETGAMLKRAIRGQFSCVMVDEAQDNDPVQADIFNLIFGEAAEANDGKSMFYMIGDPKQAIYGFRGGDVDTFIASQKKTPQENQHTLSVNYRATKEYIEAMNHYFPKGDKSCEFFLHNDIKMEEIGYPKSGCDELLDSQGEVIQPDELLTYGWTQEGEPVESAVAREILRLVGGGWKIRHEGEEKAVGYGDIAVLVRSNPMVEQVVKTLEKLDIPVAKLKDSNLYENAGAELILTLMEACLDISDLGKVRRLLGTRFFNFSAVQLDWVLHHCLNDFQENLQGLMRVWENKTFGMMFQQFLESTMETLLGLQDGEGWPEELCGIGGTESVQCRLLGATAGLTGLSVLQQLRDVLLSASLAQRLGPMGLARFLEEEVASHQRCKQSFSSSSSDINFVEEDDDDISESLGEKRLSSESPAVRVMTIHKSKGLEFPMVYLLGGDPSKGFVGRASRVNVYHDGGKRCISTTEGKERAAEDDRAEGRRLLYVGITRAECWCRWLFKSTDQKKLGKTKGSAPESPVVEGMSTATPEYLNGLPTTGRLEPLPASEVDVWDSQRMVLSPGWIKTSFSALSSGADATPGTLPPELIRSEEEAMMVDSRALDEKADNGDEGEDHGTVQSEDAEQDWELLDPVPFEEREDIFKFPGGTRTGSCWHKVFEHLDFSLLKPEVQEEERADLWEKVWKTLEDFGQLYSDEQQKRFPAIQQMVKNVSTRVIEVNGVHMRLCDLPSERMLREFEFTYRFKGKLTGPDFARLLETYGIHVPNGWARGTGQGWVLTGSIDMLFQNPDNGKFYILDWKTNGMGGNPENFCQQGMGLEMRKHFYGLQYTLYTLAFIQYYRSINPDWTLTEGSYGELLGGCIYVFVRGVDRQDRGIYVGCPPYGLMKALDAELGVGSEEVC